MASIRKYTWFNRPPHTGSRAGYVPGAIPFVAMALILAVTGAGCTPLGIATGAGAAAGVAAAKEGGITASVQDAVIRTKINDLWFKYDVETFSKLNLSINQGRVLITGVVQDPDDRVEAVRLAWQPAGVKQVINEIRVAESGGVTGFLHDSWITTQLRTKITFDRDIQSVNYSIDTVDGIVYLMGVAQDRAELNRVVEIARTIPRVKQVVSYVKMAGQKVPGEGTEEDDMWKDTPPPEIEKGVDDRTAGRQAIGVVEPVDAEKLND